MPSRTAQTGDALACTTCLPSLPKVERKIELKKFDPKVRKHVTFKEVKK